MKTKLNGTEIYFDVDGPELELRGDQFVTKPTLIALHGGPGFDQGYLRPGLGPLRDHAQVVFVDLRGQGRSARPALASCTLEQMADDVAALCALLGIERPIVLGHSAGGFVALHLVIRHPALARGVILCNTAPTLAPIADAEPAPSLASRAGPEIVAVAQRFFGGDMSPEALQAFGEHVSPFYAGPSHMDVPGRTLNLSSITLDVMQHFFGKLAPGFDVRPQLGGIRTPTLVLAGRYDWVCPPAASRAMARGISGSTLIEFAEAGHLPFAEEPEQFQDAVTAFLRAVGRA